MAACWLLASFLGVDLFAQSPSAANNTNAPAVASTPGPAVSTHSADSPAAAAPAPAVDFARHLEAEVEHKNYGYFDQHFDWDSFIAACVPEGLTPAQRNGFESGLRSSLQQQSFGARLFGGLGEHGSYRFLRVHGSSAQPSALFRLIGRGGLNYHDLRLRPAGAGTVAGGRSEAFDFYNYATGELMSQTLRRTTLLMLGNSAGLGDAVLKMLGVSTASASPDLVGEIKKFRDLVTDGKSAEALQLFAKFPEPVRKDKALLLIRLKAARAIGGEEAQRAVNDYQAAFPDDPSLNLLLIDSFITAKKYDEAAACVERLD
ncbi:MAG: hypothetical protein JO317_07455, partial [Verrucomicrobiae bacterium]|nr:hypothetical protein [Verrucomicrobiae bacterium]